jgi:beta-galactosidase
MSWSKWHWDDAVADWNWEGFEGRPLEVTVYSSCEEAELTLNNKSLGRKKTGRAEAFGATWTIPYQAGEIKATGYSGRKLKNNTVLTTTGEAEQIKLNADRAVISADGQDLSYITVDLTDRNGLRNPKADNPVKFEIDGPGTIAGVGNGNPVSLESYQSHNRRAWQGRCLVIIRSGTNPGTVKLRALSEGLAPAEIIIRSVSDIN